MEIERKWLIPLENLAEDFIHTAPGSRIEQGYLNPDDEYLVRVRRNRNIRNPDMDIFKMEIKSKGLFVRDEFGVEIDEKAFLEIYRKCPKKITKTRYYHFVDDMQYEIDFYDAYDFITIEIEFNTTEEAENFEAPDWFGEEVTYKPEYKNINLAK